MTLSDKEIKLLNTDSKWQKVESSNIEAVLFYSENKSPRGRLFIKFKGSKIYFYDEVPKSEYKALLKAESKGKFLNANIKPNYVCYSIR